MVVPGSPVTSDAASDTPPVRVALAWLVHAFTASGAVIGALALLAVSGGELHRAAFLMLLALTIDSVDGALARKARVADVLPRFDGRRLDDIVDYLNYAVVPAVFLVQAGSLSGASWAALPVLASAYGFAQREAKTRDDFFLGFPSYWNVIAIYVWLLGVEPAVGTAVVVLFSVLVFVPLRYIYPSRTRPLRRLTLSLAALWLLALAACLVFPERTESVPLAEATLAFPAYYLAASLWVGNLRRERGTEAGEDG